MSERKKSEVEILKTLELKQFRKVFGSFMLQEITVVNELVILKGERHWLHRGNVCASHSAVPGLNLSSELLEWIFELVLREKCC